MIDCGGCQGLGSHRRYCPRNPAFHPWAELADRAEDIGDRIGANDAGLANRGYALAGAIRAAMPDHPWRPLFRPPPEGWFTFGTHVDKAVPLEFSEQTSEDGMPLWERPTPGRRAPAEEGR